MAAVNPVDYDKPSSTDWINQQYNTDTSDDAPEQVEFNSSTQNAIYKDAQAGNVKLSAVQQGWIDKNVNPDDVEYTDDEKKAAGNSAIDTKGEDGEDLSEKNGQVGAVTATSAAAASAIMGCITAISLAKKAPLIDGFTALGMSIVSAALAAITLAFSFEGTFDSNLGERKAQTEAAEQNNSTINTYNDTLASQQEAMAEESAAYGEACTNYTNETSERMIQIGALQAEKLLYESQGNTQKAAEIQAQIDELMGGAEEPSAAQEEMDTYKANLEVYSSYNMEAQGAKESGLIVSEFLQDGKPMKNMAVANQWMSLAAGVACLATVCFPKLPFFVDGAAGVAAKICFVGAGLVFGWASNNFKERAADEGAASDAGDTMKGNLDTLNGTIGSQSDAVNECTGYYTEADAGAAETLTTTQGAVDGANAKLGENLGNGQGDDEGDDEGGNENPPA